MGQGKRLKSGEFIEEAIDNVRQDRALASTLLIELMKILKQDETKHQHSGPVAAKYLETLQRSNEQLVKLSSLLSKKENVTSGLSALEKSDIYEIIKEQEDE
jgi:hypothetical protein|tara:strand:- start:201 stop:506 length:306 start_codon:yes stop_codon:yes gene_type:complete